MTGLKATEERDVRDCQGRGEQIVDSSIPVVLPQYWIHDSPSPQFCVVSDGR